LNRSARTLAAFCVAASSSVAAATPDEIFFAGFGGEPAALSGILAAHNSARSAVGVGPMAWDESLAATAQAWANTCTDSDGNGLIDHNANRSAGYPWYVGENVAGSTGSMTGPNAVSLWVDEQQYYTYATNTCVAGQVCGHYTQVVWADSTHVGCGISSCAALTFHTSIVCDYGPGGNIYGEWPY